MSAAALNAKHMSLSLTVNDVTASLKYYVDGLGFEIADRNDVDGQLRFAMLKAGNAMVGIGQDDFSKGRDRRKGVGARLWISTDQDLVALASRAKAAGIMLDADPAPLPWGPMAFALTDLDGFLITITNG